MYRWNLPSLQGTYYSEKKGSAAFYCAGNGLNSGYPGLPTVALNGPDMSESSCGRCIVLQGSGMHPQTAPLDLAVCSTVGAIHYMYFPAEQSNTPLKPAQIVSQMYFAEAWQKCCAIPVQRVLCVPDQASICLLSMSVCIIWCLFIPTMTVYTNNDQRHACCCAGISSSQASAQGLGTTPFPASPTYATINNKCPECKHCDIDYYVSYPQTMNGRYTISWSYIDCAEALSLYNAQSGGSRKLLRSSTRPLDGPLSQDLVQS